jgi:hypothetical protein
MLSKATVLIITTFFLTYFANQCPCHAEGPTWQLSEDINVTLGVRDKFGTLKDYKGTFIIDGPNSKTWQKTLTVSGSDWGFVKFPGEFGDFGDLSQSGLYHWRCMVKGQAVASGEFESRMVDGHIQYLTMDHDKVK